MSTESVSSHERPPHELPVSNQVAIVAMRERHLRGVQSIEDQTNPRPWSADLFASELKQATSRGIVATGPRGVVVGFGFLMTSGFETHITSIAVDPTQQRRGVATLLMLGLVARSMDFGVDAITLEVRASNTAAHRLYERFGFVVEGRRPKYYAEGDEDAIIMWARGINSAEYLASLSKIRSSVGVDDGGTHGR